jgi:hypothetical protein
LYFVQIKEIDFNDAPLSEATIKRHIKQAINSLYEELRDKRIDFEAVKTVYLRLDPAIDWNPFLSLIEKSATPLHKLALSRFPRAQTLLLYCANFQHFLTDMRGNAVPNSEQRLNELKFDELSNIVSESGAIYDGNRYHYFRLPSGQTSDFFLRVGNCLSVQNALTIISFWSLPSLRDVNLIICDTWSISTLGMYLARLAERYSKKRYYCEYLSTYLSSDIHALDEVSKLLEKADDDKNKPLFLLSALSSGKILQGYMEAFEVLFEGEQANILAIFLLREFDFGTLSSLVELKTLCNLKPVLAAKGLDGFTEDVKLSDGKRIFEIDPRTYFPQYFEPQIHKFMPSKFTKNSKAFFERYAGLNIFSVCRDGISNTKLNLKRHHAFHIDVGRLIDTDEFKERLAEWFNGVAERPTHIVHLTKAADEKLAELVANTVAENGGVEIYKTSSFRNIPKLKSVLKALGDPKSNVIFIDAMYISGQSTAQDFEQGLREGLGKLSLEKYPSRLEYFVAVLRPDLKAKITSDNEKMIKLSCPTERGFIGVHALETILLPNWDGRKCPWCGERKLHELLLAKYGTAGMSGRERDYIKQRIDCLIYSRQTGLSQDLFFKRYPEHNFEFNGLSLWFDINAPQKKGLVHSEADAMLAIASAIQYWRDSYGTLPPAQFLLDQQTCFGVNVYNESFLRSAIWRSLKKREVDTYLDDKYVGDLLKRVFDAGGAVDSSDDFVLGWEAARLLGRYLPRILEAEGFEAIDWEYLKWTSLAT